MDKLKRVVFLDYLRVIACFMVMVIHSVEPFYLGGDGTYIKTFSDAIWVSIVEVFCRVSVPLFVMASSYLLFPVKSESWPFIKKRYLRVGIPFILWSLAYVLHAGGSIGKMAFNFPAEGGHLWFVPMLLGLYLLMPLLSPWAEKVSEKELRMWIIIWLVSTLLPFVRRIWTACYGEPLFGYGAVPYLYGECPWNPFGAFHYVSGFIGYMLIGFWFRKFAREISFTATLKRAIPLWLVGSAIIGAGLILRIPGPYPFSESYAFAVDLEMSIEYCSLGVALSTIASFMVFRHFTWDGAFYQRIVRPVSESSFGAYLMHMFVLTPVFGCVAPYLPTPLTVLVTAIVTFILSSLCSIVGRKIPLVGRFLCG